MRAAALLVAAARGRCTAAHFGTYDYTASCQITAAHQHMTHPACDFARHVMQVAFGGTGVWLSDGATNIMPVARAPRARGRLAQRRSRRRRTCAPSTARGGSTSSTSSTRSPTPSIRAGTCTRRNCRRATRPSTPSSSKASAPASERLSNFVEKAAHATLVGDVFDDAATGQGLLNYFLRATNCGALSEEEAARLSGLTADELRSGSFVKILKNRQQI